VLNQAGFLSSLARSTGQQWLRDEARSVEKHACRVLAARSHEELELAEAAAARHYWGSLSRLFPEELGFRGRDHGSRDPVNAALNYLYGVLYSEVFTALVAHGLDPYVGFHHTLRSGSPSLVFDYAEMFRVSAVDALLYRMVAVDEQVPRVDPGSGLLSRESRAQLIAEAARWMSRRARDAKGQVEPLKRHIQLYARRLAQALRGGSSYEGFVEVFRP
jgi:CRISPR-associated protein Cas1